MVAPIHVLVPYVGNRRIPFSVERRGPGGACASQTAKGTRGLFGLVFVVVWAFSAWRLDRFQVGTFCNVGTFGMDAGWVSGGGGELNA